jgi:hypothetical protein
MVDENSRHPSNCNNNYVYLKTYGRPIENLARLIKKKAVKVLPLPGELCESLIWKCLSVEERCSFLLRPANSPRND